MRFAQVYLQVFNSTSLWRLRWVSKSATSFFRLLQSLVLNFLLITPTQHLRHTRLTCGQTWPVFQAVYSGPSRLPSFSRLSFRTGDDERRSSLKTGRRRTGINRKDEKSDTRSPRNRQCQYPPPPHPAFWKASKRQIQKPHARFPTEVLSAGRYGRCWKGVQHFRRNFVLS